MNQSGPSSRHGSIPLGLIGMLALIGAVEAAITAHDHDLTTLVAANWRLEAGAPGRYAKGSSLLCFGDSMVKFGIQPRVLGPALGRPVYNFALYCGPSMASYYQLRRAFDAGAGPAAILVDFQPEILMCDALSVTARTLPELLGPGELLDLCRTARDGDRLAEFLICRLLPSARKRFEVRAAIAAVLAGRSASLAERVAGARRNWRINRGAEALARNPYNSGEIPESGAYPSMFWTPWRGNPLSVSYVDRFLDLAASRGVPVFWVLMPNLNLVDVRRSRSGYNAQFDDFIRGQQARHRNLFVIDGRHVNYPTRFFIDPVHLDRDGSTACSLGLADALRPFLDEGRTPDPWQVLPDRRERAGEVALEDSTESLLAVRAARPGEQAPARQATSATGDRSRR